MESFSTVVHGFLTIVATFFILDTYEGFCYTSAATYLNPGSKTSFFCDSASILSPTALDIINPSSASFMVGSISFPHGKRPCFFHTWCNPLTFPGTAIAPPPATWMCLKILILSLSWLDPSCQIEIYNTKPMKLVNFKVSSSLWPN